jgi:hypothetical protein
VEVQVLSSALASLQEFQVRPDDEVHRQSTNETKFRISGISSFEERML